MTGRATVLHLRARGAYPFAAGLAAVAVFAAVAAQWLTTRPFFDGPHARVPVVALAPLLAALLLGPTLAGADDCLERSLPVRWRLARGIHLALAAALVTALLSSTALSDPQIYGAYALTRNTLGCVGLVAGAAALLGARLAWLPAFVYVGAVYAAAPARDGGWEEIWAWPVQPSTAAASWYAALAVCLVGAAAHIARGCGRRG